MRWLTIRRIYQAFFLLLFFGLLLLASSGRIGRYPVSLFLEADPLLALGAALASRVVYAGTALALVVVLLTLVFGRVFCSWICPLGILNHGVSSLRWPHKRHERIEANRWRSIYQTKYYLLVALLVLALCGLLQVGLLDPIALLVRTMAVTVLPGLQLSGLPLYPSQPTYAGAWLVGGILVAILLANRYVMRLWCRLLCPLGALLGLLGKFSLFRIHRDPRVCIDCNLCVAECHGACAPQGELRFSDCVMCLNCLQACPQEGALRYRFLPPAEGTEVAAPDLSRRRTVLALATGAALVPVLRTSHGVARGAAHDVIRPPGSLAERDFAAKCVKCGACTRVCPTSVIQPAALQAGFEGLWTPILQYDVGFCSPECTLCSRVCPTGAIAPITAADRAGSGGGRPLKLGTAFYDRGRCLPWAMGTDCIVCEEVCPVSPKAIWLQQRRVRRPDGSTVTLQLPYLDPERCIGCGTCQYRCPVGAKAAIRVSSVGESRSPDNQMLLRSY